MPDNPPSAAKPGHEPSEVSPDHRSATLGSIYIGVPLAGKRPAAPLLGGILILVALALSQVLWVNRHSLSDALPGIAFFLGVGGMMVTFFAWRVKGDHRARVLFLTGFGTWVLAVGVGSVGEGFTPSHPSYWIAGLALLIAFIGGVITLLYTNRHKEQPDKPTP